MKLKYVDIKLQKLLELTNRYFEIKSIYNQIMEFKQSDNLQNISSKHIIETANIPIVIFLKNENDYMNKSSINIDGFENIVMNLVINIEFILNVKQLLLYRSLYKNGYKKVLKNTLINVIFIENNLPTFNYEKLMLLTDLLLVNKKKTQSINTKLLENIFDENDKNMFSNKFELSIIKHFFQEKRKLSISKTDNLQNHWLSLYLHQNKKYLSLEDTKKRTKSITILHCPICAKEHKITENLVYIHENNIYFNCVHKNTQFLKYKKFSINIADFKNESFLNINYSNLIKFFKSNIQPTNINNVYMVKILLKDSTKNIALKKFIKVPKKVNIAEQIKSHNLTKYYCPICSKKYLINFSIKNKNDYVDSDGDKYQYYENLFIQNNGKLEFTCDHSETDYKIYNRFSKKYNHKRSLIEQSLDMISTCFGNYLDGKKIVYIVVNNQPYIIDLANFI